MFLLLLKGSDWLFGSSSSVILLTNNSAPSILVISPFAISSVAVSSAYLCHPFSITMVPFAVPSIGEQSCLAGG